MRHIEVTFKTTIFTDEDVEVCNEKCRYLREVKSRNPTAKNTHFCDLFTTLLSSDMYGNYVKRCDECRRVCGDGN